MFLKRKTEGSVICASCGVLVGVNDDRCYNCGRRNPGLWGFAPALRSLGQDLGFVPLVMGATIILYGLALLLSRGDMQMMTLSPSTPILFLLGASGATPVFEYGRWWTLLTAGWLHAGVLHIFFNVLWIRQLGPAVAEVYGPARMVIIYTFANVVGFGLSSVAGELLWWMPIPFLRGAQLTVGASAAIFGLLGAVGLLRPPIRQPPGIASRAAVRAHHGRLRADLSRAWTTTRTLGGFLGGYVTGLVLDPLKPERVDHMVIAAVCLIASLIAIIASVITALPMLLAQ